MRFLIENSQTQEYLTSAGDWTKNSVKGEIFSSLASALKAVGNTTVEKYNVIFIDPQSNQHLKLNYR